MVYATQPVFLTHQDCANFRNGLCTLNGATVNPNGPACPNFTPKRTPQTPRVYPTGQQPGLPIQTSPTTLQPNYYLPQQFSHTPYPWEAYSYPFYPAYPPSPTYPWTTYGYGIAPWYAIPFPYPGYGYRTNGYGYQ